MTDWNPITDAEVEGLGRRLDSLVLAADSMAEMLRKLNTLRNNGSPNWKLLMSPVSIRGILIAVLIKPRTE